MNRTITLPTVDGSDRQVPLLDVAEVVALEQQIAEEGTSLRELMQRAGTALAKATQKMTIPHDRVVVLVGSGNNVGA